MGKERKSEKMTLKGYYEGLEPQIPPKRDFIARISMRCGVSQGTVYNWINGLRPKLEEHVKILSQETGIAAGDLWEV